MIPTRRILYYLHQVVYDRGKPEEAFEKVFPPKESEAPQERLKKAGVYYSKLSNERTRNIAKMIGQELENAKKKDILGYIDGFIEKHKESFPEYSLDGHYAGLSLILFASKEFELAKKCAERAIEWEIKRDGKIYHNGLPAVMHYLCEKILKKEPIEKLRYIFVNPGVLGIESNSTLYMERVEAEGIAIEYMEKNFGESHAKEFVENFRKWMKKYAEKYDPDLFRGYGSLDRIPPGWI